MRSHFVAHHFPVFVRNVPFQTDLGVGLNINPALCYPKPLLDPGKAIPYQAS